MRENLQEPARERANLMLLLQPWPGERIAKECLRPPSGPQDGVAYGYLGDMQLRLVFDEPGLTHASAVRPEDLARLGLSPQQAVAQAAANSRRASGPPQASPLEAGVYALRGTHIDYNGSYLLDRAFWRSQLEKFPQGLLAALPRKGALLFAPAGNPNLEGELARQAGRVFESAHGARISACMYRFDAQGWHPHGDLPRPAAPPAKTAAGDPADSEPAAVEATDDGELDLEKAAAGQRALVLSIIGGFVLNAMAHSGIHPALLLAAFIALGIYALLGVVRLGTGLGKSTGATIFCMVLSFVPLVSLVCWIVLSVQATRALRAAGWQVGLLGARA